MSPSSRDDITDELVIAPDLYRHGLAYRRITRAVNAAHARHIVITCTVLGVRWNGTTWEPVDEATGVSPLGAALLMYQPNIDTPEEAISAAVSAGIPWCAGFRDGWECSAPDDAWLDGNARDGYADGYDSGKKLRDALFTYVPGRGL